MSCRGLSPASIHPQAPKQEARWIPATSAGMTTAVRLGDIPERREQHVAFVGA